MIKSKFKTNTESRSFYVKNKDILLNTKDFVNHSIFYIEKHYFDHFIESNSFVKFLFHNFLEKFIRESFKDSLLKIKSKSSLYVFNYKDNTFIVKDKQFISFVDDKDINEEFKKEFTFLFFVWFIENNHKFNIKSQIHSPAVKAILSKKDKILIKSRMRDF
tara:strand:- start:14778 stop:15260 length:483 start_codon:yes stop_codon:yes gene_type:complete